MKMSFLILKLTNIIYSCMCSCALVQAPTPVKADLIPTDLFA